MFFSMEGSAQKSYIDKDLQSYIKRVIIESIRPYGDDISETSAIVMKSTGEVVVDVGLGYHKGKYETIATLNSEGIYCGIYKAVEYAFKRDISSYADALYKTGIFFNTTDDGLHANEIWRPCEIMGRRSPISMFQQVAWCSGVLLNQGKIVLRFSDLDSPEPVCTVKSSKSAIEELRKAIVLAVDSGSARLLRTPGLSVGAMLNVSEPDYIQCHTVTGFICLQGMDGTSGFTIGLYFRKHGSAGRELVATILRQVIDYMATHDYMNNDHVTANCDSMRPKYHAAEKGR